VAVNTAPYRVIGSAIGDCPKVALAGRHRDPKPPVSPGPAYVPPAIGADAQKCAIGIRAAARDPNAGGPGPAEYAVHAPPGRAAPAFSLKGRVGREKIEAGPGPGQYDPEWQKTRASAVVPAIRARNAQKEPEKGVGYVALPSELGGPRFTLKGRDGLNGVIL
jgi:hypothetical protein